MKAEIALTINKRHAGVWVGSGSFTLPALPQAGHRISLGDAGCIFVEEVVFVLGSDSLYIQAGAYPDTHESVEGYVNAAIRAGFQGRYTVAPGEGPAHHPVGASA
jgi:hypothetical protein